MPGETVCQAPHPWEGAFARAAFGLTRLGFKVYLGSFSGMQLTQILKFRLYRGGLGIIGQVLKPIILNPKPQLGFRDLGFGVSRGWFRQSWSASRCFCEIPRGLRHLVTVLGKQSQASCIFKSTQALVYVYDCICILSVYRSTYLPTCLPIYLSIYLSSIGLSAYPSTYLSVSLT